MAGGVRATGLIFNGSDDSQHAVPAADAINAKAVGTIEARQRLRLIVTAVAGLRFLIEDVADFRGIGRVADPPLLVEDADFYHAGLVGDGLDGVVESLAIVAQHVVRGAAIDHIAHPLGAGQRALLQVLPMQPDNEKTQQTEHQRHRDRQQENKFHADAVRPVGTMFHR